MNTLKALGVFAAMGIVVIAIPMILGLAVLRDRALARFLRRHPRAINITRAIVWIGFAACALLGTAEPRWLMVGIGSLAAALAVVLAMRAPRGQGDAR